MKTETTSSLNREVTTYWYFSCTKARAWEEGCLSWRWCFSSPCLGWETKLIIFLLLQNISGLSRLSKISSSNKNNNNTKKGNMRLRGQGRHVQTEIKGTDKILVVLFLGFNCVSVCGFVYLSARAHWGSGIGSPGAGLTGDSEPPGMVLETQQTPRNIMTRSTVEPALQTHKTQGLSSSCQGGSMLLACSQPIASWHIFLHTWHGLWNKITTSAGHEDTRQWSRYWGDEEDRRSSNSKSFSYTGTLKARLSYVRPCLQRTKNKKMIVINRWFWESINKEQLIS